MKQYRQQWQTLLLYIYKRKNPRGWGPIVVSIVVFCNSIVLYIILIVLLSSEKTSPATTYYKFSPRSSTFDLFLSLQPFQNTPSSTNNPSITVTHQLLLLLSYNS